MEGDEQRRRHYERTSFTRGYVPDAGARPGNTTSVQNVRGSQREGADRFRQGQLMTSRPPTTATMGANASTQDITSFAYPNPQQYASPQVQGQGSSFQYQPEYAQDPQRQQPYPQQYNPQLMYGVPQPQAPPQSPYDAVPQFQPRQSAAVEVLSNQFGVPQYFTPGAGGNTTAPPAVPPQYPSAQYQQPIQYPPASGLDRSTLASTYPGMDPEFPQSSEAEPSEIQQRPPDQYDVFYSQYQRALRVTNENAARGRLVEAGESLLEISEWLLGNAEGLGKLAKVINDQGLTAHRTHQRQSSGPRR